MLAFELRDTQAKPSDLPTVVKRLAPLRQILSFLETNSILTGVAASFVLYVSFLLQNTFNAVLLLSCFFLTISVYNINKLTDLHEDLINAPERASFVKRNQTAITLGVVGTYAIALFCAYLCNLYEVGVVLLPLCADVLYSVRLFDFRLKDVLVMKNIVIAGTFACMAVLMPLASHLNGYSLEIPPSSLRVAALLAYFIFFKIFINTVVFDVRDIDGDRLAGIVTIPVSLGRAKTKRVLLALNATFVPWLLFAGLEGFFLKSVLVLGASVVYGYWYIVHFCKQGVLPRKSWDLMVDGEWVLIAVLLTLVALTPIGLANEVAPVSVIL